VPLPSQSKSAVSTADRESVRPENGQAGPIGPDTLPIVTPEEVEYARVIRRIVEGIEVTDPTIQALPTSPDWRNIGKRLAKNPNRAKRERALGQWISAQSHQPHIQARMRLALERASVEDPPDPGPIPATDEELGLICLDDIEVKEVRWLWPDRIPEGKITLMAGEGEIGKTFLTLDVIARLTTGRAHPDRPGEPTDACDCVFVTAEDGLDDTIKPRLLRMGADVKRVFTIGTGKLPNGKASPFTIADIDKLQAIMGKRPDIKLIVIDPIAAFLGRVDENKNAELRGLLGPLAEFASKYGVAIVAITHFGKNPSTKATARILGSVAYSNAARVTWCVIPDPEIEGRCLMLRVKNNLSPNKTGMAYSIADGAVLWEPDPVNIRPNDVLANEKPANTTRKERVIEAIRKVLADGGLSSEDVIERCAAEGIGKNSVWSHKDEAGVVVIKDPFFQGKWRWRLAEPAPKAPEASRSLPEDNDGWMDASTR